jgi:hypothetical protein
MKKLVYLFSLMLMILFISSSSFAQSDQEAMQKWMAYMTPGEPHSSMAKMTGDWTYTNKLWMTPGTEPMISTGTAKIEMLMGGRYMQMKVSGTVMGMPFEGQAINAYDNSTKKYISSWIDNMGTGIMTLEGLYDAATKSIVYTGSMIDPTTGNNVGVREVIRMDSDNQFTMEMYDTKDGVESKTMEMVSTRK